MGVRFLGEKGGEKMISLKNITKRYGEKTVFENFNLDIEENKITVILGESGSGKTTLLNMIARLTDFDGEITGAENVSMVFQRDRLVPHLTVKDNILLVNKNVNVKALLDSVGLSGTENLYPKDLSAGMARRVAILRAFSSPASLILMDEPLVNLDLSLKYSLIAEIKRLKAESGKTVIFVSHDVKETVMLADRIMVIGGGKILYDKPSATERALTTLLLSNFHA